MSETENTMPHEADDDVSDAAPEAVSAERLAQLEAERDEMRERWMRSEAEMANLRSRTKA